MSEEYGWVFDPTPRHVCILPRNGDLDKHFEGALWRCGECSHYYEVWWDDHQRKKGFRMISPDEAAERMAKADDV